MYLCLKNNPMCAVLGMARCLQAIAILSTSQQSSCSVERMTQEEVNVILISILTPEYL